MKPISEKQLAANRANALKSTGPRTERGKARSAQNATSHGLHSRAVLLRCEDPEQFRELMVSFQREYRPKTATETALVNMMATARWRQMRMCYLESANIDLEYVSQIHEPAIVPEDFGTADRAGLAYRDTALRSRVLDLIGRTESRLQRQFDNALRLLLQLRAYRLAQSAPPAGHPIG